MTFAMLMYSVFGILVPQKNVLIEARDALCAGDRDFVYAVGGLGSPAWGYPDALQRGDNLSREAILTIYERCAARLHPLQ